LCGQALNALDEDGKRVIPDALIPVAMTGVARCQLRLGNIRQGIRLANELSEQALFIDCGAILEQQKQYSEAATMFVKAKHFEKAAQIYIQFLLKNDKTRIAEAVPIMEQVENNALSTAFGKVCAQASRFDDALKAYRRANDLDKVVEIQLRFLDQVQQAFDLVRATSSAQGALIVADYCQEHNDSRGAIEFLLIAGTLLVRGLVPW
jgi:WD repeat-containing protein 19